MDGLVRPPARSLRPDTPSAFPLPRRVLRHLLAGDGLGPGSRVIVGGDQADRAAASFARLGIDAEPADFAPLTAGSFDAAIWLDLEPAPAGERSLLSPAALGRTSRLLATVRPLGRFLLVVRIESPAGHAPACLKRHLAPFPGRSGVTFFRDRSLAALFSPPPAGYAVATWEAPASAADARLWRRKATAVPPAACCPWGHMAARRRAA